MELKFTTQSLPTSKLDANTGQIPDVPQNPRKISEDDMERLKKSITGPQRAAANGATARCHKSARAVASLLALRS